MEVFRTMIRGDDGRPICGSEDCLLGVRPGIDVQPDRDGNVLARQGGMSVTPKDPKLLPPHLRPEILGGFGRLPIFFISTDALSSALTYVASAKKPARHGQIESAMTTTLESFQSELCATRGLWNQWSQAA